MKEESILNNGKKPMRPLSFKEWVMLILWGSCLLGSLITIIGVNFISPITSREVILLNVIQFILTSLFSIIMGYYFTKISTYEKIDTIAKGSTEKMVHLSLQLHNLRYYLLDSNDNCATEPNAALIIYKERVNSAAEMAGSLASSNEAFRNDWLGVVSDSVKSEIEEKYLYLKGRIQSTETISKLEAERAKLSQNNESPDIVRLISQIDYKIAQLSANITAQDIMMINTAPYNPMPTQSVFAEQLKEEDTEKHEKGKLMITVVKSTPVVTGSGKVSFKISGKEKVHTELIDCPSDFIKEDVTFTGGISQGNAFNIHMNCKKSPIPSGVYVFEYLVEK